MSFADRTPQSANEGYLRQIATGEESPFNREPQSANEYWLKQIAENGGTGGGLPAYTDADADKGLFLVRDAEHPQTINIVPPQTVVLTQDDIAAELTGYDFSGVSVGDTLTFTVDGHSETVTVITGGGVDLAVAATYSVQGGQQTVQMGYVEGYGAGFDCLFRGTGGDVATRKPGTYTVSLTKSVPSAIYSGGTVQHPLRFYENNGSSFTGLTCEEARKLLLKGILPFTIDANGPPCKLITKIEVDSTVYSIFYNFGTTGLRGTADANVPLVEYH